MKTITPQRPLVSESFGYWLAGLADGEGSFNILVGNSGPYCSFHLGLRGDDRAVLEEIRSTLRFGSIFTEAARPTPGRDSQTACRWVVQSQKHAMSLVLLFRDFPLRTKKRNDFHIWAKAVEHIWSNPLNGDRWAGKDSTRPSRDAQLLDFKAELQEQRRYTA